MAGVLCIVHSQNEYVRNLITGTRFVLPEIFYMNIEKYGYWTAKYAFPTKLKFDHVC